MEERDRGKSSWRQKKLTKIKQNLSLIGNF